MFENDLATVLDILEAYLDGKISIAFDGYDVTADELDGHRQLLLPQVEPNGFPPVDGTSAPSDDETSDGSAMFEGDATCTEPVPYGAVRGYPPEIGLYTAEMHYSGGACPIPSRVPTKRKSHAVDIVDPATGQVLKF